MAFVHVYVDPDSGNDGNDGLSDANAWLTVQHAVDTVSATDGNQINLKAGTTNAHVTPTTTGVVWTSYSPTNSVDNPLIIRGYTSTENDGGVADVDGNNSSASLFEAGSHPQFVYYIDLEMHNTTSDVLDLPANCMVLRYEIYNGGSVDTLDIASSNCKAIGGHVHTGTAGAIAINAGSQGSVFGNFITQHDDVNIFMGAQGVIIQNLIESAGGHGISAGDRTFILNNTILGDGTANRNGINLTVNNEQLVILSNIIKDWSGTGNFGIDYNGGNVAMIGYNNYHNNTADKGGTPLILGLDLESFDTTTDPTFTNAGSDDYRVGANAQADGYPTVFKGAALSTTFIDVGACQREEAGAGAGKQAGSGGGQVG